MTFVERLLNTLGDVYFTLFFQPKPMTSYKDSNRIIDIAVGGTIRIWRAVCFRKLSPELRSSSLTPIHSLISHVPHSQRRFQSVEYQWMWLKWDWRSCPERLMKFCRRERKTCWFHLDQWCSQRTCPIVTSNCLNVQLAANGMITETTLFVLSNRSQK